MSKHTPGPWYAESTGNHQGLVISEITGANVAVAYDGEADTALIAAAPELLAACRATLAHMYDDETDAPTAAQLTEQLTRAIAKAEGGQQ